MLKISEYFNSLYAKYMYEKILFNKYNFMCSISGAI